MDIFSITAIMLLFLSIIALYFRPELIVGIQLFATPIFGNALSSAGINIGVVYVIFALAVYSLILTSRRDGFVNIRPSTTIEVLILLFIVWVAVTLIYTPSPSYGEFKVLSLIIIVFPCAYMARIHCDTPGKLYRTFTAVGWYAVCLVIYFGAFVLLNYGSTIRIRSSFFGPLPLAYIVASMVPFIFFVAIYSQSFLSRVTGIAAIAGGVLVIFATGSRGPLLALAVAAFFALFRFKHFFRMIAGFGLTMIAVGFYIISAEKSGHKGIERILGVTDAGSKSSDGREELFSFAVRQFSEFPVFGQGSGSFSFFVTQSDTRLYPHNTLLEIAGEFGLLGLGLYISILILCVTKINQLRRASNYEYKLFYWALACIQALFFIGFMNSNLSFSLAAQKILFVSIGLLAATTCWRSAESDMPESQRSYFG